MRTRAIHAGARPDPTTGARAVPIYQTTSFVFEDTEDAADLFALQKYGNIYTRLGNPTVAAFEERIASLEGGIGAVATGSGQAAETLLFTQLCDAGDHIVASSARSTAAPTRCSNVTLRRLGIETTFVRARRPGRVRRRDPARPHEAALHRDRRQPGRHGRRPRGARRRSPTTPASRSWSTRRSPRPYLCRPLDFGADIVLHSATKFLGGHGTSIGGAIVDSGRVPVGQRQLPGDDRAGRHLRQPALLGQLRRVRLRHQAARRGAAQPRRRAVAVQRVPDPAGDGDAAAADGRARAPTRRRSPSGSTPTRA